MGVTEPKLYFQNRGMCYLSIVNIKICCRKRARENIRESWAACSCMGSESSGCKVGEVRAKNI